MRPGNSLGGRCVVRISAHRHWTCARCSRCRLLHTRCARLLHCFCGRRLIAEICPRFAVSLGEFQIWTHATQWYVSVAPSAPRDSELTALLHCQSDYTALSIAAARGYTNILLLLLRAGANPLAKAPVVRCVHLLGRVLRLCSHRAAIACAEWLDRSPLRCGSGPCGCHGSFARGRK